MLLSGLLSPLHSLTATQNIFVMSPGLKSSKTLFEFIFKGMDALGYEEYLDYDTAQSTNPEFNKAIIRGTFSTITDRLFRHAPIETVWSFHDF